MADPLDEAGTWNLLERILFKQPRFGSEVPCSLDPALWDPMAAGESNAQAIHRHRLAASVCNVCPALRQCAELARTEPDNGHVWAGRSDLLEKAATDD